MSTAAQINANRENAKSSTGPVTEAGTARSSQNATKHGLTGQTLILTPSEREAYEAHVQHYMDHHRPVNYRHRELVQQVADSNWALHQVFIQQTATLSLMTAITEQMFASGDPLATIAALAPVSRTLATLSTYEVRRRRAVKAIQKELDELEAKLAEESAAAQKSNQTKAEPEIGFVYASVPQSAPTTHSGTQKNPEMLR
jgi:hypothetical protein